MPPKIVYNKGEEVGNCFFISESIRGLTQYGLFRCKCGKEFEAKKYNVKNIITKTCGCRVGIRLTTTHNLTNSSEYAAWRKAKARCLNPNDKGYKNYGGRGIRMCDEWLNSFETFIKDIGFKPTEKHSLDRIDFNGDYKRDNCRWATRIEQNRNQRKNVFITHNGVSKTISEWSEIIGIYGTVIKARIKRGWPIDRVLSRLKYKGSRYYSSI